MFRIEVLCGYLRFIFFISDLKTVIKPVQIQIILTVITRILLADIKQ